MNSVVSAFPAFYESRYARILFFGDVVGAPGRSILADLVPTLRERYALDLVLANGENAAGGIGLTPSTAQELFGCGVDVVSSGNHIWRHKEIYSYLDKEPRLLRPANYPDPSPGKGLFLSTLPCGTPFACINLQGRVFMEALDCPFQQAETLLSLIPEHCRIVMVDFHAEATSEKKALAAFLDGRSSLIVGTHTHVQTADAYISPKGTASITDLGMCGVEVSSVLGMNTETSISRFVLGRAVSYRSATGPASVNGLLACIDKSTGQVSFVAVMRGRGELYCTPQISV